jgi:hypothetical protein
MPYPNVGDYKGQKGLSPPAAYPTTMEYKANEGSSSLDTTSTLSTTTLAQYQGDLIFIRGPQLEIHHKDK